ncbi:unnamed protein product [Cochlearia groenlandica]
MMMSTSPANEDEHGELCKSKIRNNQNKGIEPTLLYAMKKPKTIPSVPNTRRATASEISFTGVRLLQHEKRLKIASFNRFHRHRERRKEKKKNEGKKLNP